jgi:kynurenine 3-monooxygenase
MESDMAESVTIIGAGLGGSLLALLLARRGLAVDVYERRPDMRRADISSGRSINLALANRGLAALAKAGLKREAESLLTTMRGRMVHEGDGEADFQAYGQRDEEVIYSVSRGGLNQLLMTAAESHPRVNIHFEYACTEVDYAGHSLTLEHQQSGEVRRITGGPVIAADGAGSRLRRALVAQCGAQATEDFLPHDYKELTIPPAPDGGYRLPPDALHIWPRGGFMMIALPNQDASFTATLFAPREGPTGFAGLESEDAVTAYFTEHFPTVLPLMPALARDFLANPQGRMVTVHCQPWHTNGFLTLIGDASHAIVPFHGQGMNAAFEDCAQFDELIAEALQGAGNTLSRVDFGQVFLRFEALRKPNADAIAAMALENYVEMRDSVRDPLFLRRREVAFELERRHPGVFVPRYSLVMFHLLPYAHARQRGACQQRILEQLVPQVDAPPPDLALADRLVREELQPLMERLAAGRAA